MQCPKCGGKGLCYGTKDHGETKQRYRRCRICDHRWSTWEEREDREIRAYSRKEITHDLFGQIEEKKDAS